MQQDNITFVSLFGLPCLAPTSAIADILSVYNTTMMTFSSYSPDFYALYYSSTPTFVVNGFPNSLNVISAQLKFITDHQWRRVAIVNFESEYFTHLGYELQKTLYKLGIENTAETVSIPITYREYYEQLDDIIDAIQSENYRIVIFNTYHWTASDFFCRIANRSLNFREYTFILPGSYLYIDSFDIYWINGTCSKSDLLELVSGSIGFTQYPRIKDFLSFNHKTISGLVPIKL
ncbi:gamma-aminobutyric acid type B receptor subunit 2 [Oopsacas minuta]|uniref:Gamma-aminobutyric acid type B receptor subunit 2 n=1 Tax=Oopsacas minuta TaxID=111878 RepID=A0AAV7JES8_9METZ|nr:gamma-aminobutyric acid type B receptor subunit 2 [Oopsacas minuta]